MPESLFEVTIPGTVAKIQIIRHSQSENKVYLGDINSKYTFQALREIIHEN